MLAKERVDKLRADNKLDKFLEAKRKCNSKRSVGCASDLRWRDFLPEEEKGHVTGDLNAKAGHYVLVEGIEKSATGVVRRIEAPGNSLRVAMINHLSKTLPSIAFKCGMSQKLELVRTDVNDASLGPVMETLQSGTPTVFLDVRVRELEGNFETGREPYNLEKAKDRYVADCQKLVEAGTPEVFDACSIAYFSRVLKRQVEGSQRPATGFDQKILPLWEAIKREEEKSAEADAGTYKGAIMGDVSKLDPDVVQELAVWLANRFYIDAWPMRELEEKEEPNKELPEAYNETITSLATLIRMLWSDKNFHELNVEEDLD